jgi:acyl-coenzyme A synthetase/AMP-(fatty) acid ligase
MAVVEAGEGYDEGAVRSYCLANLAKYKVPEQLTVVEQLPRNAMGKIIRQALPDLG